jgi:hypothetical protein
MYTYVGRGVVGDYWDQVFDGKLISDESPSPLQLDIQRLGFRN